MGVVDNFAQAVVHYFPLAREAARTYTYLVKKQFVMACVASLVLGGKAHADFVRGSQSIVAFGGMSGSSSQYDYNPGHERVVTGGGASFGAQYLYYVSGTPAIAIGADLASSLNGNHRSDDTLAGIETNARIKSLVGLIIARLAYPRGPYRPYIFAGVGAHNSSQELSGQPVPGYQWTGGGTENRTLIDEHQTSAAIGYGVGMDLFPEDRFFMGVEFRGTWLGGMDTGDNAALRAAGYTADHKEGIVQGNFLFRAGLKF